MRFAALGDVADLNPRHVAGLLQSEPVSFVPMASVLAETASTEGISLRPYGEVAKGYTPMRNGDLLVAKITPCFENGKIAHATLPTLVGFGSTEFHVVRARGDTADARYLLHFLRQGRIRIEGERRMTGSGGQRRVPAAYLAELKVPLPLLAEQRRIAEVLDRAEAVRAQRRQALAQLDALAESIFLDMFGEPVANTKGWQRLPMSEVLERIESGQSPVCLDRVAAGDEWAVLKLGAVTRCVFDAKQNKAVSASFVPNRALEVRNGDLLFTRKNTPELVAACALVLDTPPRLLLPDLIFRLCLRKDATVTKQYLQRLLTFPTKRAEIQKLAGGSAGSMPNISKARLLTATIERPPVRLQEEFDRRVAAIDRVRDCGHAALRELDALFASLQHRAFRGEL